jgi:hypothetical protein
MLKIWLVFFFISFAVSVLTLTYVQSRAMRIAGGWRVLNERAFVETYWRRLSRTQRLLLWTGMAAFGVTLVIAAVASFWPK